MTETRSAAPDAIIAKPDKAAVYEIVRMADGWRLRHDGKDLGTLDTRMAAFDASVEAAMTSLLSGYGVIITVPPETSSAD